MKLLKKLTTPVFAKNLKASARTVVNIGGARSSKSHSLAQLMIMTLSQGSGRNIGITRKTMPALKMTAERLIVSLLKEYGLYALGRHNKTENWFELKGSRMQFFALDDTEKIKSTEFNCIWMEEANEFTYDDYLILLTRLSGRSGGTGRNRIYLSLNPSDAAGWIPQRLIKQPDVEVIHSTYKDNTFLNPDYEKVLLNLKEQDENSYRVYALGKWGSNCNLVYPNYTLCDVLPENPDEIIYGLDFGYNNPSAAVEAAIKDGMVFARELLYSSGLTTADLSAALQKLIPPQNRRRPVYADCAEPDRIAELNRAGFNVYPADKAVRAGIEFLKTRGFAVTKDSAQLLKELSAYKWKTAPDGTATEEPVKFQDHALDALRYAVYSHLKHEGFLPEITVI